MESTVTTLAAQARAEAAKADGLISREVIRTLLPQSMSPQAKAEATDEVLEDLGDDVLVVPHERYVKYCAAEPTDGEEEVSDEELRSEDARGVWRGGRNFSYGIRRLLQHTVLSREEERALITRIRAGGRAADRERFFAHNARLVAFFATKYRHRTHHLTADDLFMEGWTGLPRALEKFDLSRPWKFSTYASYWIRQAITRAIANTERHIRLPIHLIDKMARLGEAVRSFIAEHDRAPAIHELAKRLGWGGKTVHGVLDASLMGMISIQAPRRGTDEEAAGGALEAVLATSEPSERVYPTGALLKDPNFLVRIADLDPIHREIILLRLRGWTLEELGERLGFVRERARQHEVRALIDVMHDSHRHPKDLSSEEVTYLKQVVDLAFLVEEKTRFFTWDAFRTWIETIESRPSTLELNALVEMGHLARSQARLTELFWGTANQLTFASGRQKISRISFRGALKVALRASWLAHRLRMGLSLPDLPTLQREKVTEAAKTVRWRRRNGETEAARLRSAKEVLRTIREDETAELSPDNGDSRRRGFEDRYLTPVEVDALVGRGEAPIILGSQGNGDRSLAAHERSARTKRGWQTRRKPVTPVEPVLREAGAVEPVHADLPARRDKPRRKRRTPSTSRSVEKRPAARGPRGANYVFDPPLFDDEMSRLKRSWIEAARSVLAENARFEVGRPTKFSPTEIVRRADRLLVLLRVIKRRGRPETKNT